MIRSACCAGNLLQGRVDVSAEIARTQALFEYARGRTPEEVLLSLGARPDPLEPPSWNAAAVLIADRWIEACALRARADAQIVEAHRTKLARILADEAKQFEADQAAKTRSEGKTPTCKERAATTRIKPAAPPDRIALQAAYATTLN
jgi:hypothetical protein